MLSDRVHISEVPKVLADSSSVNTHAIQLLDSFNTAHQLIILLRLSSVTSYIDEYSPSVAEYENEDIPNICIAA